MKEPAKGKDFLWSTQGMYRFKRDDNGELVEVGFEEAINQDVLGKITLSDGVTATRVREVEQEVEVRREKRSGEIPIISDNMGFGESSLDKFEADRKAHGFHGVEFIRDKEVPQFFRVKCSDRTTWERYVKHRGLTDRNGKNGGSMTLTADQLEAAKEMVRKKFG